MVLDLWSRVFRRDQTADDAFGTVAELSRLEHVATRGDGVVLGQSGGMLLRDRGEWHVLAQGDDQVVPTLLEHPGSIVVLDHGGLLATLTAKRRAAFGPTYVWDPTNPASIRFDPLLELRRPLRPASCAAAADVLLQVGRDDRSDGLETIERRFTANVLADVIVQVAERGVPTLERVWHAVQELGVSRRRPDVRSSYSALDLHFRQPEDDRRHRVEALLSTLAFASEPLVQHLTNGSDIRASALQTGDTPVTLYVTLPEENTERYRALTQLILHMLTTPLLCPTRYRTDGTPERHPVLLVLPDFPRLGYMRLIESTLGMAPGLGVRALLTAENADAIRNVYGDLHGIRSGCGTFCLNQSRASQAASARNEATPPPGDQVLVITHYVLPTVLDKPTAGMG